MKIFEEPTVRFDTVVDQGFKPTVAQHEAMAAQIRAANPQWSLARCRQRALVEWEKGFSGRAVDEATADPDSAQ